MVTAIEPERTDPHAILELLPHGVLVVASDWRVTYANPEAVRMLGANGRTLWERCPELEHTAFASGFRYAMSSLPVYPGALRAEWDRKGPVRRDDGRADDPAVRADLCR